MIIKKDVVKMKIANNKNLRTTHMYVTLKNQKKKKELFLATSNYMKLALNCINETDKIVEIESKSTRRDSPFDDITYIECNMIYLLEDVLIDHSALTNPRAIPDDIFCKVEKQYKCCEKSRHINSNLVCKLNNGFKLLL